MMPTRFAFFCLLLLLTMPLKAAQEFLLPASAGPQRQLVIYSATDYRYLQPLLRHFQQRHPGLGIRFVDLNSRELYDRFLDEGAGSSADLLLSSAMDLQLKLVNDGYARPYSSNQTLALPAEAHWRHELFAFTFEPVLTVFNRTLLGPHPVPRSQQGLMYGRLLEAFGGLTGRLGHTSNGMLNSLARGETAIGYNLLGSYVASALDRYPQLAALAPDDYTLMLMRLALIPKTAAHPTAAGELLDFMLSAQGQALLAQSGLHPLLEPDSGQLRLTVQAQGPITLIPLTPALLPPQDPLARKHFIDTWAHSISAPDATTAP